MEFPLHSYLIKLRKEGASVDYIEAIRNNTQPLVEHELPVILTLGHLAYITNVPYNFLLRVVKRHIDPYRVFPIKKRTGGKRFICVPEPFLIDVQRWIHTYILSSEYALRLISKNSTAFSPDSSHIKNAKRHTEQNWIVKLDITSFFESVSERQVYRVFKKLGYRPQLAFCLTRLCTRVLPAQHDQRLYKRTKRWATGKQRRYLSTTVSGHLPQGAPTSPMLANLVCEAIDAKFQTIASQKGLIYTRYADDMTFSGDFDDRSDAAKFAADVASIVSRYGFSINAQKTNIAKKGGRKIVTGLSVEGEKVKLPRSYKDKIRQELYYIDKYGFANHCERTKQKNQLSYLFHLEGKLRYVAAVEPTLGDILMEKFIELFPDFKIIQYLTHD